MTAFTQTIHASANGISLIEAADYAAMRGLIDLEPGVDVQAYNAALAAIAVLATTDGNIIVGNGTTWVAESGATARTSLGVGTTDSPQFAKLGVGGVAVADYPVTSYQTADSKGWKISGYDEQSTASFQVYISDSGKSTLLASTYMRLHASAGYMFLQSDTSYVNLVAAAGNPIYFDAGALFQFRDKDDSNAIRLTIDSATGELAILSDVKGLKLGEGGDVTVYCDGTNLVLNGPIKAGGDLDANGGTIHFGTAENEATIATGTNPNTCTVNLHAENHWTIPANDANNPINATIAMPPGPCGGTIFIEQGATPRDITWLPAESVVWLGTEPTWTDASEASEFHALSWRYNGTYLFLSDSGKTSITP